MVITKRFEMHLDKRVGSPTVNAVQGDTNTRAVELSLLSDGEAWTIPDGVSAKVRHPGGEYDTMPDGNAACAISGSTVTAMIHPDLTKEAGKILFQVVLVLGDAILSTFTLTLDVQANPKEALKTAISLVRGTTHTVNFTLTDNDGNTRELTEDEVLRFGVKKTSDDAQCLIEKELTGANYDVGLQNGDSYFPVIKCSNFEILKNVTNRKVSS